MVLQNEPEHYLMVTKKMHAHMANSLKFTEIAGF